LILLARRNARPEVAVQINGSVALKASLSRDHELIYPPVQEFWDSATGSG